MLKRITQFAIIALLVTSLPIPVEARSSSSPSSSSSSRSSSPSSTSSSSSFKSSPSTSSYSRSSSSDSKPSTSSSSSNSTSSFGSSFNSSYSSRPVTKPIQAVTTAPPKTPTTFTEPYRLPNTTGATEDRYVTIFNDRGVARTTRVIVPIGYSQPIVLPNTYYPATTVVSNGETSVVGQVILFFFLALFVLIFLMVIF